MKAIFPLASALFVCAVPALCDPSIVVSSPQAGATVGLAFVLAATASPCSGQPLSATGYSLDYGATTIVNAASINTLVTASTGSHTLHVKSWGNQGSACDTDVPITVSGSLVPALLTNVTVSQPNPGAELVSPFTLIASGTQCESQPIVAFGFSIDNSSATTIVTGASINASVSSALGAHTLHVKSWGNQGAGCATDIAIQVVRSPVSQLPSTAIAVHSIQALTGWEAAIDTATGASASTYGVTRFSTSPSLSGKSRGFVTTATNYGGERYDVQFGADTSASNFLYDGWFYFTSTAANIANLELDLNQVMANSQTVIFGFQCDGWTGTWDYTANAGTPEIYVDVWLHSTAPCNTRNWTQNTWHHVQISYSRDDNGNATYHSVWLDNVEQDLNVTVPDAFALGWGSTLLTNFQVDGSTLAQSTSTVYMDKLTVYRW
jgi:hypothetical protein